jgi:5-methylcytosine-specific restriction protein B
MWNFSHDKLIELIADYRADFSKNISRELYKWRAVASFHECWNIDAEEFVSMLSRAMVHAERLLESRYRYPCKMLYNFAEAYPEDVRSLFRMLYDESYSLKSRIDLFIVGMDALMARWDDSGKLKHHQSYNAVSTYLWLRFPDKYFIYKHKVAHSLFDALGVKCTLRGVEAVVVTNELYGAVAEVLRRDDAYRSMHDAMLGEGCYNDAFMVTAAIDFAEYITRYRVRYQPLGRGDALYATWDDAIVRVLGDSAEAMRCADITERILAERFYATARRTPRSIVTCFLRENALGLYSTPRRGYYTLSEFGWARYRTLCGNCLYNAPQESVALVADVEVCYATPRLNVEERYNEVFRMHDYDNHAVEAFVKDYFLAYYPTFRAAQSRGVVLDVESRVVVVLPMLWSESANHSHNMTQLYERVGWDNSSVALLLYLSRSANIDDIPIFDAMVGDKRLVVGGVSYDGTFFDFAAAMDLLIERILS